MKTFFLFLVAAFLAKGCDAQQQSDLKNTTIEYTASTRGYYMKVIIKDQTFSVSRNRNSIEMPPAEKIDDTTWKLLIEAFKEINLEKLSEYKDPTQKRFYDGAPIGNLKILFQDKEFNSKVFDHGTPPVEFEKLAKMIVAIAEPK